MTDQVRVRFCPSPTGNPHVGMIRTALFNWAYARHTGGTFVFRIEDTDSARDTEESYDQLLAALRWLGLDWDEGPEVGGPYGPYRQSQRLDVYADVARRLHEAGLAYESFSTPDEVEQRRRARGQDPKLGYDNADRDLTDEQRAVYRAEGRLPVLRLQMPDQAWEWDDLVRGPISFAHEHVPDFVIVRGNGEPLYPLVNPVDDAMMRITHVLRGEDLLSSTPRQLALYGALVQIGVAEATPKFGHLPYVMGEGNKKLSKRDPQSSLNLYRERGFLPEGLLNYLALLGWSMGDDVEIFSLSELAAAFELGRVSTNPARFDLKKCEAINGVHMRALDYDDLAERVVPFLQGSGALPAQPSVQQLQLLRAAAPLVRDRMTVLEEAPGMLGFFVVDPAAFSVDDEAVAALGEDAASTLTVVADTLGALVHWRQPDIEQALRELLVDGLGLKPKTAFTPVRVAVTGRRVAPPLFESMELLGAELSLARIVSLRDRLTRTAR
ncbi:MAG TPA: glutamate--tRNA ligase [Actinomycetes bacterium]